MSMGSTANITGLLADALPAVLNQGRVAFNVMANSNPFLFGLLGGPLDPTGNDGTVPDQTPGVPSFKNLSWDFSGTQFEYSMVNAADQPVYVPYLDPAGGYAAANWSYAEGRMNAKGNFARLILPYSYDPVKLTLIAGDRAKTVRFLQNERVKVAQGFADKLGNDVHGSSDQTDQSVSGWQLALGGATGTYLGIDMSDPDNVNFTANSYNVAGNIQFKTLSFIKNEAFVKNGNPDIAVCTKTDYNYVCQIIDGKFTPTDNDNELWRQFRGRYRMFDGTRFLLDSYHPLAGTIPFIDSRYVSAFAEKSGFGLSDSMRLPQFMAVNGVFVQMLFAVVYTNPKSCVRAYGISGAA